MEEKTELEARYWQAKELYKRHEWGEAATLFAALRDYENARSYIEKCDTLAAFTVGNTVEMGLRQGEALRWRVIGEHGKMRLLFAEGTVAQMPYHEMYTDASWRECSLRRWLNQAFFRETFTKEEQMRIAVTRVENLPSPKYHTSGGAASVDRLFLLSEIEAAEYLPRPEDRVTGQWWWLRSPGISLLCAVSVDESGGIYENGINVDYALGGVRPAMWVMLRV